MKLSVSQLMRWVVIVMVLLSAGTPAATTAKRESIATDVPTFKPESSVQHILIKVRPGLEAPTGRLAYASPTALARALMAQGVTTAQTLFRAALGMPNTIGLERIYRLELATNADVNKAVAALGTDPNIEWAEPDYIAHAVAIPDDPLYAEQWGLTKIATPAAWDIVTGTQTVIIAIIDSGIDLTHPDLQANLWINPGEIPGNGIDDDNNGYVDDVRGWNFVNGTNNVYDGNGHGSQVAGVAAAVTNNSLGIAGVCWNCKIMPVRVMADSGISNYSDIALGVRYAADKGAKVINLSLGGYSYSNALRDAIDYAVNEKGAVVVGGAGNDNVSTPFYPAAYENVLAVAGTTSADTKAAFSDYGTWVDISAPAVEITTTYLGGDWGPANGTSLAAPFVAGMAALIRSQRPDWSAALVRNQLLQTADNIDALDPAYAGELGAGRVNAAQATQDPYPIITLVDTTINGDPLGRPTPGETATLAVTLRNDWWDVTGVTGTLTTADTLVTVGQATAGYGDLASGVSGVSSPVYTFTVEAVAGYNHPIPFTLVVSANDGTFTTVIPFTITTRSGDEHFCGTVAEDMVWTNDKTYILDCNVGIAPGYTLTIQAGTEVHFNGNYNLNVGGALIADGTTSQPIRFMSHTGESWGRIFFDDPSVDAQATNDGVYQSGNLLRHVRIESAAQGIGCTNATPFLDHVTLDGGGLNCAGGDTPLWLKDSDLSGDTTFTSVDSLLGVFQGAFGDFLAVAVDGRYAYATENEWDYSVLYVVDVSDPHTPVQVALYDPPDYALDVDTSAGYVYISNMDSGLRVVDVSDPIHPTEVGFYDTPGQALGIAVTGRYAYVADGGAVRVIDAIDPTYPIEVGFYDTPGYAQNVALLGEYAYVADGESGLCIVDVSDPAYPIEVGFYDTPGYARNVALSGEYAFVADSGSGLRVVSVADPTRPTEIGFYDTPGEARSVAISDGYAYVADSDSGLRVVDVTDPTNPFEVGFYNTPSAAVDVVVADGYVYVASRYSGLRIYRAHSWKKAYILRTALRNGLSLPDISLVLTSTVGGDITAGTGSVIQNTTAGGGITINGSGMVADGIVNGGISMSGGVVQNNTVSSGGVSVGSGAALNNTITGGGISLTGGVARDNSVENASDWGIQTSSSATVEYNRIVGCTNGIQAIGGVVKGNLIANITGIGLQIGSATVEHNTFTGIGGSAIKITSGTPGLIVGNNFEFNTGAYDVENLIPEDSLMTIDARNNWWGTTSGTAIRQRIWDFNDDYNLGTVLYAPVLTAPDTTSPAYVRAITLTPESPVGIQTVAFDVEFSREMDTEVVPELSFVSPMIWMPRAPMPTGRFNLTAATAPSGKIYAIGGNGGAATVEEYDPATDTWTTCAPIPTARLGLAAVTASNGKIYTIGGYDSAESATVEEYDPATNTWTTRTPMPTARSSLGVAATPNGKIYAIGGFKSHGYLATVEEYDLATDTWTIRTPMPTAREGLAAATAPNGRIYAIGGYGSGYQATVEEYDPETDTWMVRAPMPTARYYLGVATAANGNLYAIGGLNSHNLYAANVEEYDAMINIWKVRTPMPTARGYLAVTATPSGKIYAIGGNAAGGNEYLTTVEELTTWVAYTDFYNGIWPTPNRYRALYDFNTLIPRDTYTITVSSARTPEVSGSGTVIFPIPGGGMEIAPNSAYTFTVDYAGYINDTTAPPAPTVTACAAATPDTLSATWSAFDPDSAIDKYQYAIGTTSDDSDIISWIITPLTETTRVSLTLVAGQTYYFSVKARNEAGLWSEAGSAGVVAGSNTCVSTEPAPEVDFNATPRSGTVPLTVQFTSTVTNAVTSYAWNFGDGNVASTANPTHTYSSAGSFSVTLTITGPGGTVQAIKPDYITMLVPAPEVSFVGAPRSGDTPLTVQFTSTVTNTVTGYAWSFGDGSVATTANPTHTYTNAGSFGVTLVVTGPSGTAQVIKPGYITVNPSPGTPTATFSADIVSGNAPLTVTFTAVTSGTVEGWLWTFGDGGEALTGPIVQHTYQAPGVFDVSLTVSNTHGSYTVSKLDYITVTEPPIPAPEVDFTGTPRSGDAPLEVQFTSIITGEIANYAWAFGDGAIATTANPTHTYTSAGSFSVSLVVTGPGGTTQAVKPAYITLNPSPGAPTATFSANVVSGTVPFAVTFTAVTSGTVEVWRWSFGDSMVAITGPVVQHTYQIPGVFDVSLTVSNTLGSYTVNKPEYITVSSGGHRVYLPLVLRN